MSAGRAGLSANQPSSQELEHPGGFDDSRLDFGTYNSFDSALDSRKFMDMVEDYMAYIRADPRTLEGWDKSTEMARMTMAEKFVFMINNEKGWSLARRVVPEFSTPA